MELATAETVEKAVEWINQNFIAGGSTNILLPLKQALEIVSNTHGSVPVIFLVTDGAVEDERHICELVQSHLTGKGSICPRIYTFGIEMIQLYMHGVKNSKHFISNLKKALLSIVMSCLLAEFQVLADFEMEMRFL
ncbi:uncharacterized protein LOC131180587 [Hevea brasiliensis]|uniref:uncharacterized protein LOC131180587 n=1 Tax=Hevea brasiliensis TaxID=3981 RepID=UPI0025F5F5DF|nr:uncharacterized protein LOC131180587 [Hevea brasiliensis]